MKFAPLVPGVGKIGNLWQKIGISQKCVHLKCSFCVSAMAANKISKAASKFKKVWREKMFGHCCVCRFLTCVFGCCRSKV